MDKFLETLVLPLVLEVKANKYVGTGEIWAIVREIRRSTMFPAAIADKLCQDRDWEPAPSYPPTASRVDELMALLCVCFDPGINRGPQVERQPIPTFLASLGAVHYDTRSLSEDNVDRAAAYLAPFFQEADRQGASTDQEFGSAVISLLESEFVEIRPRIPQRYRSVCTRCVQKDLRDLGTEFENTVLSKDEAQFRELQLSVTEEAMSDGISVWKMIPRICSEKLEHRTEYRRMILETWIDEVTDVVQFFAYIKAKARAERGMPMPGTFAYLVDFWRMTVEQETALLRDYLAIRQGTVPPFRSRARRSYRDALRNQMASGESAKVFLETQIQSLEESLDSLRCIRRILAQEQNWVMRHLQERLSKRESEPFEDPPNE